jgi:hypothetical protein
MKSHYSFLCHKNPDTSAPSSITSEMLCGREPERTRVIQFSASSPVGVPPPSERIGNPKALFRPAPLAPPPVCRGSRRSGLQQGVARCSAGWTGAAGWGRVGPQGCPGAKPREGRRGGHLLPSRYTAALPLLALHSGTSPGVSTHETSVLGYAVQEECQELLRLEEAHAYCCMSSKRILVKGAKKASCWHRKARGKGQK